MYGQGQQYSFGPPVTPQIIKTLMIANVVVYVAQLAAPTVTHLGAVTPADVWLRGWIWQPFTYMWLHAPGQILHILFNMFALWMFGSQLALTWGEQRFLRYYLTCGVGAGILIATVPWVPYLMGFHSTAGQLIIPTLGASGAVMGVLLAFSFTWPDRTIQLLFPPIPIKAIWLIPLLLVLEMLGPSNVSHLGHLGGVFVGWIYLLQEGRTPGAPTLQTLQLRWKRYRMRQKLRAVHEEARREQKERMKNDRPFH